GLAEEGAVLVVAGRGNNGGDGFVAAGELAAMGREVRVALVGEVADLKGDAARAAQAWRGEVLPGGAATVARLAADAALVIDALFGAGLDREVTGAARAVIEAINASGKPVLAVDLPSGVNGTTGAVMGVAVEAAET